MDKEQLVDGEWLTANHISAAQRLLRDSYPYQNGLKDTHYLISKNWKSSCTDFVQVIFIAPGHWACLTNKFSNSSNVVELYDSLHTTPGEQSTIVRQACTILKCKETEISINVINCQLQRGGSDCGLFAIAMAADLCRDRDPYMICYDQSKMRSHLAEAFEQLMLLPFPSISLKNNLKRRVLASTTVAVYCICRQPEVFPMIECDKCSVWFHQDCVRVPDSLMRLLATEDDDWYCPSCEWCKMSFSACSLPRSPFLCCRQIWFCQV